MTMACWPEEPEAWEVAQDAADAQIRAANAQFERLWPNYCKHCGGWGGSSYQESHGFKGGGSETIFDLCGALENEQCHRCGARGLSEDGEGPCKACGWNFDEGLV
jgi:hypothetical protein